MTTCAGHPLEIYRIGAPPCVYGRGNTKKPIRLWYHKKHYELTISEPPDQDPDLLLRGSASGLKGGGTGQKSTESNFTGAEFQRDFADRRSDDDTRPRWTRSTEEGHKRRLRKKSAVAELPRGTPDGRCHDGIGPRRTKSTADGVSRNSIKWTRTPSCKRTRVFFACSGPEQ